MSLKLIKKYLRNPNDSEFVKNNFDDIHDNIRILTNIINGTKAICECGKKIRVDYLLSGAHYNRRSHCLIIEEKQSHIIYPILIKKLPIVLVNIVYDYLFEYIEL